MSQLNQLPRVDNYNVQLPILFATLLFFSQANAQSPPEFNGGVLDGGERVSWQEVRGGESLWRDDSRLWLHVVPGHEKIELPRLAAPLKKIEWLHDGKWEAAQAELHPEVSTWTIQLGALPVSRWLRLEL